jgi:hypothetical protein
MTMEALQEPVRGNTLILIGAGAVMVVTLALSSKARSVTQTEVNLGRQADGHERFRPGPVSRGIVRTFITTGEAIVRVIPEQWRTGLAGRFERERLQSFDLDRPAFDLLRASVNLTVASILIVFATSLKLPLSTTFVSFMVAMGTSLADRACGRDAAVYRLAGVFSVLGGWLVTAAAAFLLAALFAALIKSIGAFAVTGLVVAAVLALIHTHRYHARRSKMEDLIHASSPDAMDRDVLTLRKHFTEVLRRDANVVDKVLGALVSRKRKAPKKLRAALREDAVATRESETEFVRRLNYAKPRVEPWLMKQLDVLACDRDLLQSMTMLVELASEHILNEHGSPSAEVAESLLTLRRLFADSFADLTVTGAESDRRSSSRLRDIHRELDDLTGLILEDLYAGRSSTRSTTIVLGVVLELRDVTRELERAATW